MADAAGIATYASFFLITAFSYGILCVGLNLQWGQTGLFNVGIAGFVAIGGYVSALLTTPPTDAHWGGLDLPMVIGWIGGAAASGLAAGLVGALTLRLRQDYLAITTFGVAVTIHLVALNAQSVTGGSFGIGFIPRPFGSIAERPLPFELANLLVFGAVLAVLTVGLERLVQGPWGRALRAVREDERAAASLGKNPTRLRLQAFALGGVVMGLGGAMHAHFIGFIAPDNYQSGLTFQVWAMLIVGGSGNMRGAILGAMLIWGLWSASGFAIGAFLPADQQARAAALQIVAIGVLLAAMIRFRPKGLLAETVAVSRHLDPR